MSSLILEAGYASEVLDHPNADRMKIAVWKGWNCCVGLDFSTSTHCVYFQPDLLLPHELAEELGVTAYLKVLGKDYPERERWAGRVSVARLRSVPSYGILAPVRPHWEPHLSNLADFLGVDKYSPPEKVTAGDSERDSVFFPRYTDIENLRNFPDTFEDGEHVLVTEKIHGTNCRIGICPETDNPSSYEMMAGSHGVRRRKHLPESDKVSLYWKPLEWYPQLENMINEVSQFHEEPVIVYGEIYGSGVQDLAYGFMNKNMDFRVFDIKVGDKYVSYESVMSICDEFDVPMVPILFNGPFSWEKMSDLAEGYTTMEGGHIREGIVIRPWKETVELTGRKIRKLIGFGYLNRKGGTEDH